VEGNDSTNPQGLTAHFSEGDDDMAEAMRSRSGLRGAGHVGIT
jgi:hypothetical protein